MHHNDDNHGKLTLRNAEESMRPPILHTPLRLAMATLWPPSVRERMLVPLLSLANRLAIKDDLKVLDVVLHVRQREYGVVRIVDLLDPRSWRSWSTV